MKKSFAFLLLIPSIVIASGKFQKYVLTEEDKQRQLQITKEIKEKGYLHIDNWDYPEKLHNLEYKAKLKSDSDIFDSVDGIKIDFKFKPFEGFNNEKNNVNGFVPLGSNKNKKWAGIKEIFKDDKSTCTLSIFNLKSMDADVFLRQATDYYVNNHYQTTATIMGSKGTRYIYNLSWLNNTNNSNFLFQLECERDDNNPEHFKRYVEYMSKYDQLITDLN